MMKKLLYILLLLPALCFGQTQLNINQIAPNNRLGGVWAKSGTVMTPDFTADENTLAEPTVIYEGSPQILTTASGSVFKMWFTGGFNSPNIYYAESPDGITWSRRTTAVVTGHARSFVIKVSSTYYMFTALGVAGAQIDRYTSSDGITWTLTNSAVIAKGTGTTWNSASVSNIAVINDSGTLKALVEGTTTSGGSNNMLGYYSSADLGITWTASGSNPVISSVGGVGMGNPYLAKIGSTFYAWVGGTSAINIALPTDIYRWSSSNMTSWAQNLSSATALSRTMADEGVGTTGASVGGQVADPSLVEVNGRVYMFYAADPNGGTNSGSHIKLAIANYTLANLILTNEGDGGQLTLAQPDVYDKTASDLRYLQGGTTFQSATLYLQSSADGFKVRDPSTTTTVSNLTKNALVFSQTSATNTIQSGSAGFTFTANEATGGFTYVNSTGTIGGLSAAGNWSVPSLTLSSSPNAEDGSAFDFMGRLSGGNINRIASKTVARVVYTNSAVSTLTNSTAATSIIPTGVGNLILGQTIATIVGAHYRVRFGGVYSTTSTPTMAIVLQAGGTTVASTTLTALGTSVSSQPFTGEADIVVVGIGTSSSCYVDGHIDYNVADQIAPLRAQFNNGGAATTVSNMFAYPAAITMTGQWSAASASNILKVTKFSVEVIN